MPFHFTDLLFPNASEKHFSPSSASPNYIRVKVYHYFQSYCLVQHVRILASRKVQSCYGVEIKEYICENIWPSAWSTEDIL